LALNNVNRNWKPFFLISLLPKIQTKSYGISSKLEYASISYQLYGQNIRVPDPHSNDLKDFNFSEKSVFLNFALELKAVF